jgi:hypothetical protein
MLVKNYSMLILIYGAERRVLIREQINRSREIEMVCFKKCNMAEYKWLNEQ